VLRSNASPDAKSALCRPLSLIGGPAEVPALAALLPGEATADAARLALERIPGVEAGAALRAAVGPACARLRVGLANSLGNRGENAAAPELAALLADADPAVAEAAAAALGRLNADEALQALLARLDALAGAVRAAADEACLTWAERLAASGRVREAADLYARLCAPGTDAPVCAAAMRGLALTRPEEGLPAVGAALGQEGTHRQVAALAVLRECPAEEAVKLAGEAWATAGPSARWPGGGLWPGLW